LGLLALDLQFRRELVQRLQPHQYITKASPRVPSDGFNRCLDNLRLGDV
jgi:hypothetical protein